MMLLAPANRRHLPKVCTASALLLGAGLSFLSTAEEVSFQRDIRPVLSDNCFQCHGPDASSRKADLRLDLPEHAMVNRRGGAAVIPGDPDGSTLIQRITHADPGERMPPPESGKFLDDAQIASLRAWIAAGAEWPAHWAFVPPSRPELPAVRDAAWVRTPVDAFVLARLEREGLAPAPEADPVTLLRRLSLDLTGLPPTVEEIDAHLDEEPGAAFAAAVERLLDSPHHGERWARPWLDAAQYADSDGFEKDKPRRVWAWRDWVIRALNANMPYDRFLTEQIAGDLLPGAGQDQIVATGFLRNSMVNEEGGIDPEQFRMEAVFNRLDVIGRAVLGLTVNCAQCHAHKYDPLSHAEYYGLLAYVNNSHEASAPVYSEEEQAARAGILRELAAIDEEVKQAAQNWPERLRAWEEELRAEPEPAWHTLELTFDDTSAGGQKCLPVGDGSYLAQGYAPTRTQPKMAAASPVSRITAVRIELLTDPNLPKGGPGRSIYGSCALSEFEFFTAPADQPIETMDKWERVEIASAIADIDPPVRELGPEYPDKGKRKAVTGPISMALDGNTDTAWTTDIGPAERNQPRHAIFKLAKPLDVAPGTQLGIKLVQTHGGWNSDDYQTNNLGRFRLSVTGEDRLPERAVPARVKDALRRATGARSAEEQAELFRHWRMGEPEFAFANIRTGVLWARHPEGTTQLVYQERETPRVTHRLDRGDFLRPLEPVAPGVPAFLNPMPAGAPANRLGLAQWITDRNAPTTARAFVNRVWQQYFGTGLTATASDLGVQGEAPSHPELLDWLAVEFMESGWDIKRLHRLIVSSATYRQSSAVTPELLERDPANRLLARGARYRVEGEIVRDIALAASGLLHPAVGGPSVYPPAPEFLFQPPASYGPKTWWTAEGREKYRRALYTFRYRSVPYPVLQAFDAPPGDAPCVQRVRSNTPLQALTTLNEPIFLECAQALAANALNHGGATDAERLDYAFRRCTARMPGADERETLLNFLARQRERIASGALDPGAILSAGVDPPAADRAEWAAWSLAARVLLNLDETITRE